MFVEYETVPPEAIERLSFAIHHRHNNLGLTDEERGVSYWGKLEDKRGRGEVYRVLDSLVILDQESSTVYIDGQRFEDRIKKSLEFLKNDLCPWPDTKWKFKMRMKK